MKRWFWVLLIVLLLPVLGGAALWLVEPYLVPPPATFDVSVEPIGMLGPKQFVADFSHLPIARVVYEGKLTGKFAEDVRRGVYRVIEGVVCKGGTGGTDLWMVKIKTYEYMERLKRAFADRWEEYWE